MVSWARISVCTPPPPPADLGRPWLLLMKGTGFATLPLATGLSRVLITCSKTEALYLIRVAGSLPCYPVCRPQLIFGATRQKASFSLGSTARLPANLPSWKPWKPEEGWLHPGPSGPGINRSGSPLISQGRAQGVLAAGVTLLPHNRSFLFPGQDL